MRIYQEAWEKIARTVGSLPAETGGVIALDRSGDIADFYFDAAAVTGKAQYIPSRTAVDRQVNQVWGALGYRFGGVVHSHPPNAERELSGQDILMAEKILRHNGLDGLLLTVVQGEAMSSWWVSADGRLTPCELEILK